MEYYCHVWTSAPSCYLELLGKLQKWTCRTVGISFATSLEPLAHRQNIASLSLDRLHDFSVAIPRHYMGSFLAQPDPGILCIYI